MINVTLNNEQPAKEVKPFPKLMKGNTWWIIYAISKTEVFHLVGPHAGQYSDDFANIDRDFTDYNEPLTIQNA